MAVDHVQLKKLIASVESNCSNRVTRRRPVGFHVGDLVDISICFFVSSIIIYNIS